MSKIVPGDFTISPNFSKGTSYLISEGKYLQYMVRLTEGK